MKWSRNYILVATTANNQNPSFQINNTKPHVPVVTLSTQENRKLLKQLKSGFKRTINWNKYLAKTKNQSRNRHLDYLIVPSFHGVNRIFVLSTDGQESQKHYYLPTMEIKNYNARIDGRKLFWSANWK